MKPWVAFVKVPNQLHAARELFGDFLKLDWVLLKLRKYIPDVIFE